MSALPSPALATDKAKKTAKADKLPRGLWVGKTLKTKYLWRALSRGIIEALHPGAVGFWAPEATAEPLRRWIKGAYPSAPAEDVEMAVQVLRQRAEGKAKVRELQWADENVPEYWESFYYQIRIAGKERILRSAETTDRREAVAKGKLVLQGMQSDKWAEIKALLDGGKVRGKGPKLGELLRAFEAVAKARKLKEYERSRNSVRLVGAIAHGIIEPLSTVRMDADGGRRIREVEALPAVEVLCEKTALAYAMKMQEASGAAVVDPVTGKVRINLDKNLPPEVNGTINSTLGNARVILSEQNRILELGALKVDWDTLEAFGRLRLPEAGQDVGADIPTTEQFHAMHAAWERLRGGSAEEQELALVNELLRLQALRSGELVMARESWIHTNADGKSFLWVRNRPEEGWSCKSSNMAKLPLSDAMATRLRARCEAAKARGLSNPFLILPLAGAAAEPGKEQAERRELVRETHNAWLKGFIGEVKSGHGNHRLRKFCATALYAAEHAEHHSHDRAAQAVKEYLRHSKEATALCHYIARHDELLRTMTDETLSCARG